MSMEFESLKVNACVVSILLFFCSLMILVQVLEFSLKPGEDSIIWCPDPKGGFSSKSAWDVVRHKGDLQKNFDWVWHPLIPKKISFMIWKGLHKALSVDLRIKEIGINLASKCNCCESPSQESEEHILSTGDFADSLWRKFDSCMGLQFQASLPWRSRLENWCRRAKKTSQSGTLMGILPFVLVWLLWKRRCRARFEDILDSQNVCWRELLNWAHEFASRMAKEKNLKIGDKQIMGNLSIPFQCPIQKTTPKLVEWKKPMQGWMKLNVDGASKGNPGPAGGGGTIRNEFGILQMGFSNHYGDGTNMYAELRALLDGVRFCVELGYTQIQLESDSQVLVQWINQGQCSLWYLWDYWDDLKLLLQRISYSIEHIYREANSVADHLANLGTNGVELRVMEAKDLPREARGAYRLDLVSYPSIRL